MRASAVDCAFAPLPAPPSAEPTVLVVGVSAPPCARTGAVRRQVCPWKPRAPASTLVLEPGGALRLGEPHSGDAPVGGVAAIVRPAGRLTARATPFNVRAYTVRRFGGAKPPEPPFWVRTRAQKGPLGHSQ
jgi:hypothetical protein